MRKMFQLRCYVLQATTITFCNEENTVVIQGKPDKKRQRKVREKSTSCTKRPPDQSRYTVNIHKLLKRALEVMAKNEMMSEIVYGQPSDAASLGQLFRLKFP